MKRFLSALFVSAFVLGGIMVAGCDSSGGTGSRYQERTINASSGLTAESLELFADLSVSKAEPFSAVNVTVIPSGAKVRVWADTDVVSFIENPEHIKDSEDSWIVKFKPNRQGEFTVNVESGSVKKTVTIKVTSKLSSITVTGSADPIDVGNTVQLKANKNPSDSPATVTWASSDANVATVDQNGLVTAKAAGVATITATSTDTETDTYNGADVVSGYFDVTVKGFFLSDTSFFLCNKDKNDEVEAKFVGIGDGTVTWTPDASGVFTVTVDPSDNKKAKLNYVDGKQGQGKLTATVTVAGKTYEATADVDVHKFYMLALGDSIAAGYAPKAMGGKAKDEDLEQKVMIAAYEEYMNRRKGGSADPNYVNQFSYPAVLKKNLSEFANITLQSYARTGDQTKDLLAKLAPNYRDAEIATKKGEILEAVKQADYITLCIGANDILQRATGINIFMKDLNWFRETFASDLENFKANFDTILGTLADDDNSATVYVMSVYSPYIHFTGNPPIPDSQYTPLYKSTTEKIVAINGIAQEFLSLLNTYISEKAGANPSVTYVDVATVINAVDTDTHKTLIHADPKKFNLDGLVSTFGQTIPIWFDPHPTIAGAVKIAEKYNEAFPVSP